MSLINNARNLLILLQIELKSKRSHSMRLRRGIFVFGFQLVGPMALFINQPSDEKRINSNFSNKKKFTIMFLAK